MKEYNEQSAIMACKNLLGNSHDVLSGNGVSSTNGCLYYDIHNGLIDAIGLLGGDVTKYSYIDPNNPDIEGRN
tara:strand:- start:164 stop:382 length:219 start_codon:yes stop_codon:yes gene_type:complete